jgi:hypothetical protein
VVLGLLKIANIRRSPIEQPKTPSGREIPLEPTGNPINPASDNGPELNLPIRSCDSSEDELLDRHAEELAREQAEADRIREEEAQTELEELQAAADARAAEEQAALDDLPTKRRRNTALCHTDAGGALLLPKWLRRKPRRRSAFC